MRYHIGCYDSFENKALDGANAYTASGHTEASCMELCTDFQGFDCLSAEFDTKNFGCTLSMTTTTPDKLIDAPGIVFLTKKTCPAGEYPISPYRAGVCRPCDTIELTATSCDFSLCRRVEKVCVNWQLLRYS